MSCPRRFCWLFLTAAALAFASRSAFAVPTQVVHQDDPPHCDPLLIPFDVDELGNGFPPDELISSSDQQTTQPACIAHDNTGVPNALVSMTNLTRRDFVEVWYVADIETSISNWDGWADTAGPFFPTGEGDAFRIDMVGVNTPLVFESKTPDGVFEAGETWQFIIQDYFNALGLPASAFGSIGVRSASPGTGTTPGLSSGSIIAIPEPATAALFVLIGVAAVRRRR